MTLRGVLLAVTVFALQYGCDAVLSEPSRAHGEVNNRDAGRHAVAPEWCLPQKVGFDPQGKGWLTVSGEIPEAWRSDDDAFAYLAQPIDKLRSRDNDLSESIGYLASDSDQILWRPDGQAIWVASRDKVIEFTARSDGPVDITPAVARGTRRCPESIRLTFPEALSAGLLPMCLERDGSTGPELGLATISETGDGFWPIGWPASSSKRHERTVVTVDASGRAVGATLFGQRKIDAFQFNPDVMVELPVTDSYSYANWVRDRQGRPIVVTDSPPLGLPGGEMAALAWDDGQLVVVEQIARDQPTLRFATARDEAGVEVLAAPRDTVLWDDQTGLVRATIPSHATYSDDLLTLQIRADGRPSVVEQGPDRKIETELGCPADRSYDVTERVELPTNRSSPLSGWLYRRSGAPDAPLAIVLHGGPRTHAFADAPPAEAIFMLSRGYQVLAINYAGSTGAGMALRSSLYHEQAAAGEQALSAALDWVSTQTGSRDYRPVLLAGSYGSYIAALNPGSFERFEAVILSSGVYNPAQADTPLQRLTTDYSNLFMDRSGRIASPFEVQIDRPRPGTRVLILHGADDRIARATDARRYVEFLKDRGFVASGHVVKGAGHQNLLFQRFEGDTLPAVNAILAHSRAFKRLPSAR